MTTEIDLTDRQVGELITEMSILLNDRKFAEVNSWLAEDPKNMETMRIVTYMRLPYMARNQLSNWKGFVLRAKDEFDRRGKNGAKLCQGLI